MNNIFINPGQLKKLSFVLSPWLASISVLLLVFGIWLSFFNSPIDYQQGNAVRMMYIHVPSAWLSMMIYVFLAVNSFFGLVYGHVTAFCLSKAAAPIGLTFTAICLVTGSAWGKPMWGAWWVWDARLTSVLILFFFYLGYIIFSKSFNDFTKGERFSSILSIIGIVNLPIIKFSVDYWNTLHQPASISKLSSPSIHIDMLTPLLVMFFSFLFLFLYILALRLQAELNMRKINISNMKYYRG
ncbi:MAG: heme ABC transporter permease [Rhizobiales bacterium TMED168]|nr:MAG: heme ABC transporter permease [Rhizobiales bacterium TMED168]|tara:strand:+ start:104925 stop:105647 length:723 start_codon:yes stop_codon:yes gene_type:complete